MFYLFSQYLNHVFEYEQICCSFLNTAGLSDSLRAERVREVSSA